MLIKEFVQSQVRVSTTIKTIITLLTITSLCSYANEQTDYTELSLEELMNIPVYAASKRSQSASTAPASITVVTSDEIKKYGHRNLADILNSIQGFYTTSERNYDYLGNRGFNRPGDYNSRILILINSQRLNDAVYESVGIDAGFPIDVDLIDRVEVIRGPGSSMYGTSAFFTVINVITKTGKTLSGTELSYAVGSSDHQKGTISYGQEFKCGLKLLISGSLHNMDGHSLYFKEFDDPSYNNGISLKDADRESSDNYFLQMLYKHWSFQLIYGEREKYIPTAPWGTVFTDSRNSTFDKSTFAEIKYEAPVSDTLSVMTKAAYNYYDYDGYYLYDYTEPGMPELLVLNIDEGTGEWLIGETKLSTEALENHKASIGIEYRNNINQQQKNYDEGEGYRYVDIKRDSELWGFYIDDEITINEKCILNLGVRYDHYDEFSTKAHPRLALLLYPDQETVIKVLFGSAFRAPSFYESYYNDSNVSQKGNPDLKPEEIITHELVIQRQVNENISAECSIYHYEIDNLISQTTDPVDELIVFENVENIEANGFEINLASALPYGAKGKVSYSFARVKEDGSSEELSNSPENMVKMGIIFPVFTQKLNSGLEVLYLDERRTISGNVINDYIVANLTLLSQNILNNMELSASIYNVFDQEYSDPGAEEHLQDAIIQDGANYRVKLTYRF